MTAARSRSAATHQALMDAALRVFVQRGFARATTREIAGAAGVAEGTIYRHFADKHALFREVFFSAMAGMGEELRRLPEGLHLRPAHQPVRADGRVAGLFGGNIGRGGGIRTRGPLLPKQVL